MRLKAMTLAFDRDLVDEKLVVIESHVTGLAGKDRTHKMTILKGVLKRVSDSRCASDVVAAHTTGPVREENP